VLLVADAVFVCSHFFQKVCQHRGKAGVSKTLLTVVKSHVATDNNAVMNLCHCIQLTKVISCWL